MIRASLLVCLFAVLGGCASGGGTLATRVYAVDVSQEGASPTPVLKGLELPLAGELYLYPRWLQLHIPGANGGEPVRLQTALRVVRRDGSVTHWWLGAERSAPAGEGGRTISPQSFENGASSQSFGEVRLGPLRLEGVVGLELLVSELPGRPEHRPRPRLVGAAVLARAPMESTSAGESLDRAVLAAASAGGALRMATHLPIVDREAGPGRHRLELVFASQEGDASWPESLAPDHPDRGNAWVELAPDRWRLVMVLGLEVDLQNHDRGVSRGGESRDPLP